MFGFRDPVGYLCLLLSSSYFVFRDTLNVLQVVGPVYWISRDNVQANIPFVSVGFMRELDTPWRVGKGIQITKGSYSFQIGVCHRLHYTNPIDGQLAAMDGRLMDTPPEEIGTW
jgi:hypothetical protein